MSVLILLSGRSWTSVQNTDLDDHLSNDGVLNGPTYIARHEIPLRAEDFELFKYLGARQINEKTWSCKDTPATIIAKLYHYGYKLLSQAGCGCGFSGKARYSADVAVTDYRWCWTMVRDAPPDCPPPYGLTQGGSTGPPS